MFRSDRWLQSTFAGTSDGKKVEGIINSSNFLDRVFKLVQIIEPLYEVLRVVDADRRPSIGLVYAKLESAKKKIREVSPWYAHLVLDVVEGRWDRQMSRDLHKAAYYLHPAHHYTHELAYEDDLMAVFTRVMKSFREAIGGFVEPSAIAGRVRIDGGGSSSDGGGGGGAGGDTPQGGRGGTVVREVEVVG
ncbi:hypothetical protein Taro_035659 [Colocasia esculenta]|uniref:Uncharacterized protein n=1 Tax=Colocasia esculenta TaxID=4460 RepID=A0A843W7B3_COLES|nr:hypothetical protein [Colocasia esculenta]